MVENLKRFRETLTLIVMVAMVANMVVSVVRLVIALSAQGETVPAAFQDIANSFMNLSLVVMLGAMVLACLFIQPRTRFAVTLAFWAATIVSIGTLLTLVAAAIGLSASAGVLAVVLEFLGGLLDIVIKATAAGGLWLVWRAARTGRFAQAAEPQPEARVVAGPLPGPELVEERPAPMWRPDEASGAVWMSAADAAAGGPASGQGVPGQNSSGWRGVSPETDSQELVGEG